MFIDSYEFNDQLSVVCINKHNCCHNLPTVAKILFNLMVGNFLRDTNSLIHQKMRQRTAEYSKDPKMKLDKTNRKLKKLKGDKY